MIAEVTVCEGDATIGTTVLSKRAVGWVADKGDEIDDADEYWAGRIGIRYLIARQYDLRVGADVARGARRVGVLRDRDGVAARLLFHGGRRCDPPDVWVVRGQVPRY